MPEYLAPGVYVEETSFRPKSIEGVSTSTTAFVGPTRKGPVGVRPEIITSAAEFQRVYGGVADLSFTSGGTKTNYLAHAVRAFFDNGGKRLFVSRVYVPPSNSNAGAASFTQVDASGKVLKVHARQPGSGLNGSVKFKLKETAASEMSVTAAPSGSFLRTGGAAPAKPASLKGGRLPFTLKDGDELNITVSGAAKTITFNGQGAEAKGDGITFPLALTEDKTIVITINGIEKSIVIPQATADEGDLLSILNAALVGAYVRLEDAAEAGKQCVVVGTDRKGKGAQVVVAAAADFGFSTKTEALGSGNVDDLTAVKLADLTPLFAAVGLAVSMPSTDGMAISTTTAGKSATLAVGDTPARTIFGFPSTTATGEDGASVSFYAKAAQSWADSSGTPLNVSQATGMYLLTFSIEATDADGNLVVYDDLGFGGDHPRFVGSVLKQNPTSQADVLLNPYWIQIQNITPFEFYSQFFTDPNGTTLTLASGSDGQEPTGSSTVTNACSFLSALEILEKIEDISILAAPGYTALADFRDIQGKLISHAERMKYRFAVLDTPQGLLPGSAQEERSYIDSKRAAMYYPWVVIANPLARPDNAQIPKEITVPPSGFIAGVFARSDVERGVWKPPANEVVRGALRFEMELTHGQQELLNPAGVNCLRFFPGRGFRVWGARTASSDPEWKYVNVMRYFIYLERSIDRSTQWAVFEPNGERLWANIRDTISAFLYNEWRSGALLGATPEEAYFVRCDRSTMTQNDIDNGRLICEIGVAAIKPAEFVIFRIGQKTADARS